jgi:hypothetical protein
MSVRVIPILFVVSFSIFVIGMYWKFPYSDVVLIICGIFCFIYGIYEAVRPGESKKT